MATPVMEDPLAKSKKPSNSAFKQQRLPAWQPILTAGTVLPTFFVIGLAFIPIGIGLLVSSNDVREFPLDYTHCVDKDNRYGTTDCGEIMGNRSLNVDCICELYFNLTEAFKANVFMYYGLTNYYQNHRRYVKSRDDQQLLGRQPDELSKDCAPFKTRDVDGKDTKIAPCGAIANSLFNDTLKLEHFTKDSGAGAWIEVSMNQTGIIWPTDHKKFQNPKNMAVFNDMTYPPNWHKSVNELDPTHPDNNGFENEQLIVWMRTAALPTFRKLYGRIDHDVQFRSNLPSGQYRLTVNYRYPVLAFKGTKRMILSNTSWLGGKNPFLGVAYIVVGTICLMLAFVFLVIHNKFGRSTHDIVNINQRTTY